MNFPEFKYNEIISFIKSINNNIKKHHIIFFDVNFIEIEIITGERKIYLNFSFLTNELWVRDGGDFWGYSDWGYSDQRFNDLNITKSFNKFVRKEKLKTINDVF